MSATPRAPERHNFVGTECPRCYRKDALSRPAADTGLYRCSGCFARFRFIPATNAAVATLERVIWTEAEYNAGARIADDLICQCCGARGHSEVTCAQRNEQPRSSR